MDWMTIVQERGEVTTQLAREIPAILARDDISEKEINELFSAVHKHCSTVEDMVSRMSDDDTVNEHLLEAAEALEEMCDEIGEAVSLRLIEIRTGRRPVFDEDEPD